MLATRSNICSTLLHRTVHFSTALNETITPSRAVIVSKLTRYGYERIRHSHLDDEELKTMLLDRGSDYFTLKARHDRHEEITRHVCSKLEERGINWTIVSRAQYSTDSLKDVDLVISAGGDGTYLLTASKIQQLDLPLIGVNTDPERSEGYLCLSRKYSFNFGAALKALFAGHRARFLRRKRIRITMCGKHENDAPVQLLEQQLNSPEQRFSEHVREHELNHHPSYTIQTQADRVLPVLALNDVFIGESLSARVSSYEISLDNSPFLKQKSSGITICTGTGSSSWHFNINSLQTSDIKKVLKITSIKTGLDIPYEDKEILSCVHSKFNKSLYFSPSCNKMAYTMRDPIRRGFFHVAEPKGFAERVEILSKMWDACLVVDGGVSFKFNDGAKAKLEMVPEDDLLTVQVD